MSSLEHSNQMRTSKYDHYIKNPLTQYHCHYILTKVLPKSVEYISKLDLDNLYWRRIVQYHVRNCYKYITNKSELRKFVLNKIIDYYQHIISIILQLKPSYHQSFYQVCTQYLLFMYHPYTQISHQHHYI